MLTDRKRKKLLAGVLAAVMLTSTAGCGTEDKDSDWQNDNASQEEKKDGNGGGFFSGFFPWYFIGRTFGVGPMAGVRQAAPAPNATQKQDGQQTAAGGAGAAANRADGKSSAGEGKSTGSTVQQGGTSTTQKSTLGSTGSSGKSGIGSGLSRSSGSAIS